MPFRRLKGLSVCCPGRAMEQKLALVAAVGGLFWFVACEAPVEPIYVTPHPATQVTARPTAPPLRASPAPLATARYSHTTTLLDNGQLLVVGGKDGSGALGTAELYDPMTNSWSAAGALAAARDHHTATLLPNGKVLVAGGRNSDTSFLATAELYDPGT